MNTTETVIVSARHLGVLRLRSMIEATERKDKGALALLKVRLGIKGDRDLAIRRAKASLANVANW